MQRQKIVNVWQGGLDAARERFIIARAKQRIQPYEPMAVPLQARHLELQKIHVILSS